MLVSAMRRMAVIAGIAVLLFTIGLSGAQQGGGSGLIISEPRYELEIEPGGSETVKVTLRNVSGADVTAKAEVNDFESDGHTGEPKIITDKNRENPASIQKFLKGVTDIDLKKDEKKDFEIGVNIPAGTPAGAYYGVVRYSVIPTSATDIAGEGKVALTASVGSLILIQVPGNIREQVQVRSVRVGNETNGQFKAGSFFTSSPSKVAIEVKNNGNGFSKPFGRINVYQGNKEAYAYELNNRDEKANILPGSVRTFTDDIKNVKAPGRYSINANVSHGSGGEVISYKTSFWYIPTWLLGLAAALLAAVVAGAYLLYRKKFARRSGKKSRR